MDKRKVIGVSLIVIALVLTFLNLPSAEADISMRAIILILIGGACFAVGVLQLISKK